MMSSSSPSRVLDDMPTTTNTARSQPTLSVSELRAALQQELRQNGVLKDLKTQLRGSVLTELMRRQKAAALSPAHRHRSRAVDGTQSAAGEAEISLEDFESHRRHGGGESGGTCSGETPSGASLGGWAARVSDSLVENHLRRTRRPMSLSIFATEAEVYPLTTAGAPSEEEQYLARLLRCGGGGGEEEEDGDGVGRGVSGVESAGTPCGTSQKSLLQQLVLSRLREDPAVGATTHRHSCSTQTDDTTQTDATNPLTSMECRLAAVDAKYALAFSQLRQNGAEQSSTFFTRSEVDRRLQQYQHDIREQLTSEFQAKYRAFEQGKLQEVKAEQEARYQNLVHIKEEEWRETERSLVVKMEQERQRLALAREDVERQKLTLERRQREVTDLVHDHHVAQNDLQAQIHDLKEKCRALQLQSSKWEELCGSRLVELEASKSREIRRVDDMRRMQAEFAAELRLKEEDVARLRFRVRTLLNQSGTGARPSEAAGRGQTEAAPPTDTAARMHDDLYHVLVRTEELQRNALRQQQQGWEQAWNAQRPVNDGATGVPSSAPVVRDNLAPVPTQPPSLPVSPTTVHPTTSSPMPVSPIPARTTQLSSRVDESADEAAAAAPQGKASAPARAPSQRGDSDMDETSAHSAAHASLADSAEDASPAVPATKATVTSPSPPRSLAAVSAASTPDRTTPEQREPDAPARSTAPSSSSPSSPASTSASASPSRSREDVDGRHSAPGDKSPSSASSAAASSTHDESNAEQSAARADATADLVEDEAAARAELVDGESSARAGIQWSESSQREVLNSQAREQAEANAGDGAPRTLGFIDQMEQQRAQEELQRDNIIFRDDDDDGDSILFGGKSDGTDESF